MQPAPTSFTQDMKTFIQNHPYASICVLPLIFYAIGNFCGRVVTWIKECCGSTKKTDDIARNQLSNTTPPDSPNRRTSSTSTDRKPNVVIASRQADSSSPDTAAADTTARRVDITAAQASLTSAAAASTTTPPKPPIRTTDDSGERREEPTASPAAQVSEPAVTVPPKAQPTAAPANLTPSPDTKLAAAAVTTPAPTVTQTSPPTKSDPTRALLESAVKEMAKYPFPDGYCIPKLDKTKATRVTSGIAAKQYAISNTCFEDHRKKMVLTPNVTHIPGVGGVGNCYTWKTSPSVTDSVPHYITNPAVRLPKGITAQQYAQMRKTVQEGVTTLKGINDTERDEIAIKLGGIIVEGTLLYKAQYVLNDEGENVNVHCIFHTGLNFSGNGGMYLPKGVDGATLKEYSKRNAEGALNSAINNKSQVLIFNIGIGAGLFGGMYGNAVKQANVDGICAAVKAAKANKSTIEVVVPDMRFTDEQRKQLTDAGISIVKGDKDALAALCARQGQKVSLTVAGDPMSSLGIHGPGLWWETVGSLSDEERAAFLSPCYLLGHIPIDVYEEGQQNPTKIAALSEFMITPPKTSE